MSRKIFFWSQEEFNSFSNFTPVELAIDGLHYSSVEHYYQSQKSTNPAEQETIRLAKSAYKSKKLGQKVKENLRIDWDTYKIEVMTKALYHKFQQEPFKSLLRSTQGCELYEDSPYDTFWGTGELAGEGSGQNHLGKLLMALRDSLN